MLLQRFWSEKVLRYACRAATEARAKLTIIYAVQAADPGLPMQLDLRERVNSAERQEAGQRIAELQRIVGTDAPVRIEVGSVKEPLLEAALRSDADVLIVGRSPRPGVQGRMRYLTYAMVRDSPFHVLSI